MDERDLAALYRNRFPREELARKNAIWQVICRRFLQRYVAAGDTVLDLACGYGEFINNIEAAERIAVDLNPETAAFLDRDVRFVQGSALALDRGLDSVVDVVFTSNFLEHLPDKRALESLLDSVRRVLRPGGRFLVLGPNLRYLPGRYWDYYDHQLGLTHLSLAEVLTLRGYRVETCIDRFLPYTTRGALPTHPALVRAYLALPPVWRLLGKQFFLEARPVAEAPHDTVAQSAAQPAGGRSADGA